VHLRKSNFRAQAAPAEDFPGREGYGAFMRTDDRGEALPSFLNYAPVALAFGTSGLRGLVKDITDLEAYINVKAALRYMMAIGDIRPGSHVVIAGDLRPSTDRILGAAARAVLDVGCLVEYAGKIPTPALVFRAISKSRAGVMVTGSHIPFDRNGIKLNKSRGEILKSDEAGITREVERLRIEEYGRTAEGSAFDPSGMLKVPTVLPAVVRDAEEDYVARYLSTFPRGGLAGQRIVVYQHSAVGRDLLARLLRDLGADVVEAGRSETFVAIDTESITDEQLARLEELAVAAEANGAPVHAVVSTDGDSDRPLVAAVLPASAVGPGERRVRFMPGDLLGIVVAEYLAADAVAVPISANDAVELRMAQRKVTLAKTKIGSPYVIAALDELRRDGSYARIAGWEANGGFLLGSDVAIAGSTLAALPTRDAMLPLLANLFAAAREQVSLPVLWSRLPARFGRSGLLDHVPSETSRAILALLVPAGQVTEVAVDRAGTVLDRSSVAGGAPLDRVATSLWQALVANLGRVFTAALGFDGIVRISVLDGTRVHFANGDVAHVRPSGNAPQLRIYANSDSQARADQIVDLGLREPDGILREIIQLVTTAR
jgi:phosphomannomutase